MQSAKKVVLGIAVVLASLDGLSQTGPGGVGNSANNAFWIRADLGTSTTTNGSPVSSWQDVSGNGNDISQTVAVQQPLYTASLMNSYPAVLFDNNSTGGQNDYFSGLDDPSLDNTNGLTIFTVVRQTNLAGAARSIIAKRTNVGVNQAYMFFFYTSDRIHTDIVSNDNRFSTPAPAFTTGTNYILSLHYDGTLAAASRAKVYSGQTLLVTSTESDATIPNYNSPLIVGATHVGDNMHLVVIWQRLLSIVKHWVCLKEFWLIIICLQNMTLPLLQIMSIQWIRQPMEIMITMLPELEGNLRQI